MTLTVCPGCGIEMESEEDRLDEDYNASVSCRKLYFDLSYYTLSLQDSYFIHQLIVDTYAAQHFGKSTKSMQITFALIGLYLVFEHYYSGKQVQNVHILLGKRNKEWPRIFIEPEEKAKITVLDVVRTPDEEKNGKITEWAKAVWETWKPQQGKVERLLQKYLPEEF